MAKALRSYREHKDDNREVTQGSNGVTRGPRGFPQRPRTAGPTVRRNVQSEAAYRLLKQRQRAKSASLHSLRGNGNQSSIQSLRGNQSSSQNHTGLHENTNSNSNTDYIDIQPIRRVPSQPSVRHSHTGAITIPTGRESPGSDVISVGGYPRRRIQSARMYRPSPPPASRPNSPIYRPMTSLGYSDPRTDPINLVGMANSITQTETRNT